MSEMPFYTCHKRVQALEIEKVGSYCQTEDGLMRNIWFVGDDHWEIFPDKMFARYVPKPGDFFVRYEDGYESFSPRKAFLEGYTREDVIEALPQRIDQAMYGCTVAERDELLRDCRAEITWLRRKLQQAASPVGWGGDHLKGTANAPKTDQA